MYPYNVRFYNVFFVLMILFVMILSLGLSFAGYPQWISYIFGGFCGWFYKDIFIFFHKKLKRDS